ncbi:MAG: dTDP-4-dehydrorhamnose reductase [Muribaculaceae bacterium]|nr:dTDP-4-dehydrorhamnose reductase [Muribaculaceae bacterium]
MKILITGCNGQLGQEMRNVLETEYPGNTLYTDIAELDLTDAKAVVAYVADNDITHIVNCAAYTAVDRAEEEKALCTAVNVDAVKNIANAADAVGAKVVHVSTDYVFDGTAYRPYSESDKVNPISQYGTTKRTGETALLALAPESIIVRTGWLYSPYGKNFVKTMRQLGRTNKEIKVVADQIGTPTYALDLAKAIYKILRSHQWVQGVYHYSDMGVCSWYDLARAVMDMSGITTCRINAIPTEEYPTVARRPYYSVLNKSRIRDTYDVEVPYWRDSLHDCITRLDEIEKN